MPAKSQRLEQWLFVVGAIALVLGFEIFNSCIERMASWPAGAREQMAATRGTEVADQRDREIGLIKDAAASGVLISSIAAGVAGLTIFFHRFLAVFF